MKRRGAVNERVSMRSLAQYRMTIWWIRDFLAALCCPGVGVPGSFRTTCATGWTGRRGCRDRWHEKIKHMRPGCPEGDQQERNKSEELKNSREGLNFPIFYETTRFLLGPDQELYIYFFANTQDGNKERLLDCFVQMWHQIILQTVASKS